LDEVVGNFAEARGAVIVGREFGDGFCGKIAGNLVRTFETVDGRVGGFLLRNILAGRFSEYGGSLFDIENVVGDLEEEAEGFAKTSQPGNVFSVGAGA
jgi:hypothetical protein